MPVVNLKFSLQPPAESRQLFLQGLRHLYKLHRIPGGLTIQPDVQPIYSIAVKRATTAPAQPSDAQLVGWRFFAGDVSTSVVAGDVSASSPPKLLGLIYGDVAKDALKALLSAKNLPQLRTEAHEARLLRIPGALVQGFWFKPETADSGLFLQYRPVFELGRDADFPVGLESFLGDLRPADPPKTVTNPAGEPPPKLA